MLQSEIKTDYLEYCLENDYCTSEYDIKTGLNKINIYPKKFKSILILHGLLTELSQKYNLVEISESWIIAMEK